MRTKNVKRLWPVPVTLGVMALAAFLAFGLMATNGAQPAEAQDAPCVKVTAGTQSQANAKEPATANDNVAGNDGCDSSSSEAIIELAGAVDTASSARTNYVVYGRDVNGTSSPVYPPETSFGDHDQDPSTSNVFYTGTAGGTGDNAAKEVFALAAVAISVGPATVNTSGVVTSSKETITLSGAPLSTGYVYVAQGTDFTTAVVPVGEATTPKTGGADSVTLNRSLDLEIIFLGPPVTTAPDLPDADETPTNTNREPRSNLRITSGDKTIGPTETDDIVVTAVVKDEMDRNLKGKITYTVEFVEGSALASGQQSTYTTRQMDYDADFMDGSTPAPKGMTHMINGWATGTDPVRINVSAIFTGGTGTIMLPLVEVGTETDEIDEIVISRAGKLDRVEIVASCYAPSAEAEERKATKAEAKICGKGTDPDDDTMMVDMRQRTVYRAGQMFTLKANAVDTLGTDTRKTITLDLPDVSTAEGADAFSGSASLDKLTDEDDRAVITIHEKAPPSKYDLTVKATEGSGSDRIEREATISIIVSGDPETYTVTGPEYIALTSFASGEFTVTATDDQGNPPNFGEGEDMVLVAIESDLDPRVTGLDANDMVMLDEETGTATFTIGKPAGAENGDTANIGIFVGDELMDQITVTFGMMGDETGMDDELTAPSDVDASYVPLTGSISMNWTPGQGASRQMVVLLGSGSAVVYNMTVTADTSVHDIRAGNDGEALAPGDYRLFVLSIAGSDFEAAAFAITVPAN